MDPYITKAELRVWWIFQIAMIPEHNKRVYWKMGSGQRRPKQLLSGKTRPGDVYHWNWQWRLRTIEKDLPIVFVDDLSDCVWDELYGTQSNFNAYEKVGMMMTPDSRVQLARSIAAKYHGAESREVTQILEALKGAAALRAATMNTEDCGYNACLGMEQKLT